MNTFLQFQCNQSSVVNNEEKESSGEAVVRNSEGKCSMNSSDGKCELNVDEMGNSEENISCDKGLIPRCS